MITEQRRGYRIEIRTSAPSTRPREETVPDVAAAVPDSTAPEVLLIDGKVIPYIKTQEGIRIYYQTPKSDLLEAARSYVDTQREKTE